VGAFSSHADGDELAGFAESCRGTVEHVFLVHGEEPQAQALAVRLRAAGIGRVTVPEAGAFHDIYPADMAVGRSSA
jgi:Cft2 family RNA processing exonuclease